MFDRICRENGIKHLLTAPRSPTTTGKVERWHKTLRREFLNGKVFASLEDAQRQLDGWVRTYNFERPHQSIGKVPPNERFRLAITARGPVDVAEPAVEAVEAMTTRRVAETGTISFATASYLAGRWLAGQTVEVVCAGGLVEIHHRGVLIATHARRHPVEKEHAGIQRGRRLPPSPRKVTSPSVTRKVDSSGSVCFAGNHLSRRSQVQAPPGAGRGRRRHRRDLPRRRAHPQPSRPPRPHPRARRPRQPRRPTQPHQRRMRVRPVTQLPGSKCRAGTGA